MASDSIGNALSLQARLQADLQRKGVAADKASLVASDVDSALKSAQTTTGGRVDRVSARSAIEQRLNDDVASGKLSTDDATLVRKTLDEFDKRAQQGGAPGGGAAQGAGGGKGGPPPGGPPPGGGAGGPPPGGGGGGAKSAGGSSSSDSSEKTEVQRTSSTTGGATTTTITYADGSTETKTTYGTSSSTSGSSTSGSSTSGSSKSGGDELVDLLKSLSTQKDSSKAETYLKDLLASDLVDFYA